MSRTIYNYNIMIYEKICLQKSELVEDTRVHTVSWLKFVLVYTVRKQNRYTNEN